MFTVELGQSRDNAIKDSPYSSKYGLKTVIVCTSFNGTKLEICCKIPDLDSLYNEIYTAKSGTDMINGDTPIKLYELKGIPSNFTLHGIELSAEQYYTATYYSDKGTKFVFKKVNEQQAESYWNGFGDNYEILSNNIYS